MRVSAITLLAVALLVAAPPLHAQPETIGYQGELRTGGMLFDGTASMKMAIVENGLTLWSNDGTSSNGSEPTASFQVTVTDGIFSVRIGDGSLGMFPLSADLFDPQGYTPELRVWVDTGGGFEQLPDQPFSASLFAVNAEAARWSVGDFYVGGTLLASPSGIMFDDGSTMTTAPMGGGGDSTWSTNGTDVFRVNGNVGVGTIFPLSKFEVHGISNFFPGNGNIQIGTPGGWPGLIAYTPLGKRRDIIFDENGMRLLAGPGGSPPGSVDGITITNDGYVGVKGSPRSPLDVRGEVLAEILQIDASDVRYALLESRPGNAGGALVLYGKNGSPQLGSELLGADPSGPRGGRLTLFDPAGESTIVGSGGVSGGGGNFDLYTGTPATQPSLQLQGNSGGGGRMSLRNSSGVITATLDGQAYSSGSQMRFYRSNGQLGVEITAGVGEIKCFDANGANNVWITGADGNGDGHVRTDVLEITGGSDLSERFDISDGDADVEPGMVVSIDRDNPGQLVVSDTPYEKTVAGIVSGAGGVKTGMLMGQEGTAVDGEHPVALTGRVWAWCDASGGAIEPGDMLTTSVTPGHAMKVTDPERAHGAVIGKAMSSLSEGRGLVLVLVGLQ